MILKFFWNTPHVIILSPPDIQCSPLSKILFPLSTSSLILLYYLLYFIRQFFRLYCSLLNTFYLQQCPAYQNSLFNSPFHTSIPYHVVYGHIFLIFSPIPSGIFNWYSPSKSTFHCPNTNQKFIFSPHLIRIYKSI